MLDNEYTDSGAEFYKGAPKRMLSIFDVLEFEEVEGSDVGGLRSKFNIDFHCEYGWGRYFVVRHKENKVHISVGDDACNHTRFCGFMSAVIETHLDLGLYKPSPYGDHVVGRVSGNHIREDFFAGNQFFTIDLKLMRTHVKLLVRDRPDLNYEDAWFYFDSTPRDFFTDHHQKTHEELKKPVLMAVHMEPQVFLGTFYLAVLRLVKHLGHDGYQKEFGKEFPHQLMRKLELVVMLETPEWFGFYQRDHAIYEGNYPKWDMETLTIPSRRIRTLEELDKDGIMSLLLRIN